MTRLVDCWNTGKPEDVDVCSLRTSSVTKAIAAAAGTTVKDRCGPALIYLRQQGIFTSVYEIKLDEYRAIAVKSEGTMNLYSRRRNSFNRQYHLVYGALGALPDNTALDGEIVALGHDGRPTALLTCPIVTLAIDAIENEYYKALASSSYGMLL